MIQNADNELSKFEEGGKLVMDKNEKLVSIPNQNHSDYLVFYSKEELFLKNICYYHSLSTWTKESQHKKKYLSLPYE
ncbi:MAG: hypothetical protein R2798_04140 [Chitinophagales bacterium]